MRKKLYSAMLSASLLGWAVPAMAHSRPRPAGQSTQSSDQSQSDSSDATKTKKKKKTADSTDSTTAAQDTAGENSTTSKKTKSKKSAESGLRKGKIPQQPHRVPLTRARNPASPHEKRR